MPAVSQSKTQWHPITIITAIRGVEWLTTLSRTSSFPARPNRRRIHPTFRRCRSGKEEQDTHKCVLYAPEHLRVPERVAGRHSTVDDLPKDDMPSLMETHAQDKVEILKDYNTKLRFISTFARPSVRPRAQGDPPLNASIDSIVYRGYADLNLAVDTPRTLVTSVLGNTETN